MTEPTTAGSLAAALSAAALALFGVPWLALLWSTIGAVVMLVFTPPESRAGAILTVVASALVGAALGHAGVEMAERLVPALAGVQALQIMAALVCGAGAKPLLTTAIERAQRLIAGRAEGGK
jgi:hypothetical protein